MNVTLRKANTIQNNIQDVIKSIKFESTIKLNEFQDAEAVINSAGEIFIKNLQRRDNLLVALYEIRKAVSKANDQAEISHRLAEVAHLEKQISFFENISSNDVREDEKVIAGKLEKIRNRKDDARSIYGHGDEIHTSIFDKDELDGFKKIAAKAKKSKQKLQDEILELNVRTEISLSEVTVGTLAAEGLI